MASLIEKPTEISAYGNKPKIIKELIGRVNTKAETLSVAQMESPQGWVETGQTPEFDEYSIVLRGTLHVKTRNEEFDILQGQAVIASKGEWVQYSTPNKGGAQYIAICLPAFSPENVHRDA